MAGPKLFVSYSWTSPDREAWVLELATDLRESGIDVILDKWDLKEGHDAHAFMERMVTDPEIEKVILVCDKAYVDKTDGRSGGVGTEAQIISGEIYEKQAQDKFVAIVIERDDQGTAYLPAYYRSRIYIDMSDPSTTGENFERLLRWAYGQPLYKKPTLGEKPAYLSNEKSGYALATSSRYKRAIDALRNSRDSAIPAAAEYFEAYSAELEKLRIEPEAEPFDEYVVKSIESFIPYRNEAIDLFATLALYRDSPEARSTIHRFFEKLIPYLYRPQHITSYRDCDFDNFRFVIHELYLYAVANFIRHERYESANYLMTNGYYVPGRSDSGRDVMASYEIFWLNMPSLLLNMPSLFARNERLDLRRLSMRADLLEQRCKGIGVEFRQLMQADFILFLRDYLHRPKATWHWRPETLLYVGRHSGAFEVFARSQSSKYFDRAKILLGIQNKDELMPLLDTFRRNYQILPRWGFESFSPHELLGFNDIATKP